ncbi:DUF5703 family protein [Brachybacterium nesterenkovii]|uniref:DUF5703 family protein n=1 Tax=Brachybacterium nesterenkovii TaxID=47847 RepID=UPI00321B6C6D
MTLARPPRPAQVQHLVAPVGVRDLPVEKGRRPEDYEFQIMTIPRRESIASVRQELTDRAEYGRWELARTRIFLGGDKKVWLRRRITRVVSTLHGPIDA